VCSQTLTNAKLKIRKEGKKKSELTGRRSSTLECSAICDEEKEEE
jgi:hypothetical protein